MLLSSGSAKGPLIHHWTWYVQKETTRSVWRSWAFSASSSSSWAICNREKEKGIYNEKHNGRNTMHGVSLHVWLSCSDTSQTLKHTHTHSHSHTHSHRILHCCFTQCPCPDWTSPLLVIWSLIWAAVYAEHATHHLFSFFSLLFVFNPRVKSKETDFSHGGFSGTI